MTLATSDADGAYRQATAHASMIPSRRGSARDLASQQHGVGGALQHLRRGFRRRAGLLARLRDESGRRVNTTYGWTRRKHSRPLSTAIGFASGQQCEPRLGSLAILDEPLRVDIGIAKEESAAIRLNPSVARIAAETRG